jgi:hypothetical protein
MLELGSSGYRPESPAVLVEVRIVMGRCDYAKGSAILG